MTSKMYWAMRKAHEKEIEKLNDKIKQLASENYPHIDVMGVPEEAFVFGFKFIDCEGRVKYTVDDDIIKALAQIASLIHRTEEIVLQSKNRSGYIQADRLETWLQYVSRCIGENINACATAMYLETACPMFDMRNHGKK